MTPRDLDAAMKGLADMHKKEISKRGGGTRTIWVPGIGEKMKLRGFIPALRATWTRVDTGVAHGCVPMRGPVTCAQQHVGFDYTLSMDLRGFFDGVRREQLFWKAAGSHVQLFLGIGDFSDDEVDLMFPDGAPRQGLPTSPWLANIAAAVHLDPQIQKVLPPWVRYTRYVDDLTFSFNAGDEELQHMIPEAVRVLVGACGWTVNEQKTRVQQARHGRRIINGVSVGPEGILAPRTTRRRLRAAKHQGNADQASGLAAWCEMTPPKASKQTKKLEWERDKVAVRLGSVQGFQDGMKAYMGAVNALADSEEADGIYKVPA